MAKLPVGTLIPIGAVGTAKNDEVLQGKTYSSDEGVDLKGTMPNNGTLTKTLTNQGDIATVAKGYYTGGTVKANITNLIGSNVKKGIRVGGVLGTYSPGFEVQAPSNRETCMCIPYPSVNPGLNNPNSTFNSHFYSLSDTKSHKHSIVVSMSGEIEFDMSAYHEYRNIYEQCSTAVYINGNLVKNLRFYPKGDIWTQREFVKQKVEKGDIVNIEFGQSYVSTSYHFVRILFDPKLN